MLISLVLAWLTYVLIERPIRFGHAKRPIVSALCGGMLCIAAGGLAVYFADGFPSRLPEIVRQLAVAKYTVEETTAGWRYKHCFIYPEGGDGENFSPECIAPGKGPMVALWGDSHAAALYPALQATASETGLGVAQFTASACPPLVHWNRLHADCARA